MFRENCFENVVSDVLKKMAQMSKKLILEKIVKTKKNKTKTKKT